ncbi:MULTISPECIES: CAP domain-containing protein [Ramlibacter]|uniref:SCP domain-containing protein n=1 Tax=Ramlibacter aquaticus TaxID=2780094 RepID=A0ABR9S9X6_9BURK|nr:MULTISPECIES: CAP domain-containing protein [Ramlibacter]MBE7939143.1 hypothetical protein [Ramlibacter aquaticus]
MRRVRDRGSRRGALFLFIALLPGLALAQGGCAPGALAGPALDAINRARARGARCGRQAMPPAPPMRWSPALAAASAGHAADMARRDYFEHLSPEGARPGDRARSQGYRYRDLAENIALGDLDAAGAVRLWLGSPPHCLNLMDGRLREVGVGCADSPRGPWERRWAMLLGLPR